MRMWLPHKASQRTGRAPVPQEAPGATLGQSLAEAAAAAQRQRRRWRRASVGAAEPPEAPPRQQLSRLSRLGTPHVACHDRAPALAGGRDAGSLLDLRGELGEKELQGRWADLLLLVLTGQVVSLCVLSSPLRLKLDARLERSVSPNVLTLRPPRRITQERCPSAASQGVSVLLVNCPCPGLSLLRRLSVPLGLCRGLPLGCGCLARN